MYFLNSIQYYFWVYIILVNFFEFSPHPSEPHPHLVRAYKLNVCRNSSGKRLVPRPETSSFFFSCRQKNGHSLNIGSHSVLVT